MNYPEISIAGIVFNVLRQAIALNYDIKVTLLTMENYVSLFGVKLDPPLSETLVLSDYDANLPIWKEQFVERAKMFPTPHYDNLFLIGYEIGQLATWLIGALPKMNRIPDIDGRIAKALESVEVIKELCAECKEPIAVIEMLEKTAGAISASANMDDLKKAADMIRDWKDNEAMFNFT